MSHSQQHSLDSLIQTSLPTIRRTGQNPLLSLSIARRLILGFMLPALIAALASGIIGVQSAQLLDNESSFYQGLFKDYASLVNGDSYLQLMNTKLHGMLTTAATPSGSTTLKTDQASLQSLAMRYDSTLRDYARTGLIDEHPDQVALFSQGGQGDQIAQQRSLALSAARTWSVYHDAQDSISNALLAGDLHQAQSLSQAQGDPTLTDALSALHTLIQFDGTLVASVRTITNNEQNNLLLITGLAALTVFCTIALVGWIITNTLVPRLSALRKVVQSVEKGDVRSRVSVGGKDEISDVAYSVNGMLDTIVGLLEETRQQRDALVNASERLFSDMRVANGGDLRGSTMLSDDPITMLANAFQFTIGRFQRFVLRVQTAVEQLEVISRQEIKHTDTFEHATHSLLREPTPALATRLQTQANSSLQTPATPLPETLSQYAAGESEPASFIAQLHHVSEQLLPTTWQTIEQHVQVEQRLLKQAFQLCQQATTNIPLGGETKPVLSLHELRNLKHLLQQTGTEIHTMHQQAAQSFQGLGTAMKQLATSEQSSENASPSSIPPIRLQGLVQINERFAQDIRDLAQRLTSVTQEIRVGLAPYRLDVIEKNNRR